MRAQYPGLDVVRFAAALLVTGYHLGFLWWARAGDVPAARLHDDLASLAPFLSSGWVGVPIFFMLSGFVIAFSADDRSVGRFVVSRVARLYPAAWWCCGITALAIAGDPLLGWKLAGSLILSPWGPWVSGVYWTLAVEIVFYGLVAAAIATRRPRALRHLGTGMALVGAGFWLLRAADFATGGRFKSLFALVETPHGGLLLVDSATYFGFGLMLWSIAHDGATRLRVSLMAACLVGGLIGTAAGARFNVVLNHEPAIRMLIAPAIYLAGAAAIVTAVVANGWVERRLGPFAARARTAGLLTYPLYLVHSEVGMRLMRATAWLGSWIALVLGMCGVLAIAAIVLRLERYPRRIISAIAARSGRAGQMAGELP